MKAVLQRVKRAQVTVDGAVTGRIGPGLLILLGVHVDDTPEQADWLAPKCAELRIFHDDAGQMSRSLVETGGGALVVSQFTLLADCRKGRRPSWHLAASPAKAQELYNYFVSKIRELVPDTQTGVFGAMMEVELVNDGPVTIVLDRPALAQEAAVSQP